MGIVEAIRDAEWRVLAALDAAGSLPETALAQRRECVERALKDARAIREPSRRVVALARVADRLIDLAEGHRATQLLDEAWPIAESLPMATSGGRGRVEFAETLARVQPARRPGLDRRPGRPAAPSTDADSTSPVPWPVETRREYRMSSSRSATRGNWPGPSPCSARPWPRLTRLSPASS